MKNRPVRVAENNIDLRCEPEGVYLTSVRDDESLAGLQGTLGDEAAHAFGPPYGPRDPIGDDVFTGRVDQLLGHVR